MLQRTAGLTRAFAADEALHLVVRDVVGNLSRRMFHEVGRDAEQRPTDSAIACQLHAAYRVDGHPGRVRAVLDREPRFELDDVSRAVLYMASLPLSTNVLFMTVMATKMPFVGRG